MIRKLALALALALWLAPLPALAALAIDSQESGNAGHNSATSPLTWSFTNTAGTLLIVGVCVNDTATGTPSISAVTYNGVAMSAISGTTNSGSNNLCTLYQLLSPATGAHTVSVTYSGNCGGCFADAIAGAISFTGNNPTTPTGNPATASNTTGTSTAATVSVPGTANGDYVVSLVATGSGVGTAAAPTAISWKLNVTANDAGDNAALGQQTTSGGTVSAGFNVTADLWFMSAIEVFAPVAAGPAPTNGLELVSVGGTLSHGDGSPGGGGALAPGFFVSNTGNDNNAGTLAAPWATIFHAQQVMRGNNCGGVPTGLCLTYVRGGFYTLTAVINFTSADNGETVQFYPPDGVNTAQLDGGGTLDGLLRFNGATNITINGLKLANPLALAIFDGGGSTGLTIENSDIGNNRTGNSGLGFSGFAPLVAGGSQNFTFSHNYVHDAASMGVVANAFNPGDSIAGTTYSGNVVLRTCLQVSDCGGLYVSMHGGEQGPAHTVQITNNFIRDLGAAGVSGVNDIYLDDNENSTDVIGNIVGPLLPGSINPTPFGVGCGTGQAFCVHNGHDNAIKDNIVDLGLSGSASETIVTYGCDSASIQGMAGNSFTNNVVVANWSGTPTTGWTGFAGFSQPAEGNTPAFMNWPGNCPSMVGSWFTFQNNDYVNYGGGVIPTHGFVASDTNPQKPTTAQLQCSTYTYTLAGGSIAFTAPVNFVAVTGGWGPPGFTVPSSTNHSCP